MFEGIRERFSKKSEDKAPLFERLSQREQELAPLLDSIEGTEDHKLSAAWEQDEASWSKAKKKIDQLALSETVLGALITVGAAVMKQPELAVATGILTGALDVKAVLAHLHADHGVERARMRLKNARARLAQGHV